MNSRLESRPPRLRTGSKSCAPSPTSPPPSGAPNNSYLREYALIAEYGLVQRRPLPGIYVIPSEQSCATWHGVAFPRAGLYRGGAYRFTLDIPAAYPDAPPRVVFAPPPFHPLVDAATGALDVARAFAACGGHRDTSRDVLGRRLAPASARRR
ncbi:PREDICTED: AKT-interacting protein-like [Priapulus caudatus]|uniref:AKT-interacting protein-like n=1 Tax=Priapulus caudatus TaxID=37621 RepID=A0ABM1EJR6_PRICU|nr:PREDICTED: AKT-interacting protein-like [Priapulus caudatus]